MNYKIEYGRISWSYKGENVCIEACGPQSIRVAAAFKIPVDSKKVWNLFCSRKQDWNIYLFGYNGEKHAFHFQLCEDSMEEKIADMKEAVLECGETRAHINEFGQITFFYKLKQILKEEWIDETCGMPPFQKARNYQGISSSRFRILAFFQADKEEHLYGMGQESRDCMDLKGCTVDLCQKNTKCTIPFYVSSLGYGFLWNNPAVGRAELAKNRFLWEAGMARQLDYVVIGGGTPEKILKNYTHLTGRIPAYPEWILGLWQSKLRYRTQEEVLLVAREYKKRQIPLSVLVIDYFHWKIQGDWKFDARYFPNPKEMNEQLEEDGIHLMVSVWPTVDSGSENYRELSEKGYLMTAERGPDVFFMCRGAETYLDATSPEAGRFLGEKLKQNYTKYGITSFWLDEAEPEIYPYSYENMRLAAGNGLEVSCSYPYDYNQGIEQFYREEGVWHESADHEADGIILARSGWIGSQRLRSVLWSGDVPSTFESFRKQIMAGLHMSMCGIVFWTTDIGGFYGGEPQNETFRELMVRWFQFGVFCPILRMHGYRKPYEETGGMEDMSGECNTGGANELWSFGEEVYSIMLDYLQIRLNMLPYIKKQLQIAAETGTPLMRPLIFDFPSDERVYDLGDEYMFGSRILVAPVTEYGVRKRTVYLPKGIWISAITRERIEGGRVVEADAPLEKMPVFYRVRV